MTMDKTDGWKCASHKHVHYRLLDVKKAARDRADQGLGVVTSGSEWAGCTFETTGNKAK